jgi:hypothetical protein
MCSQQYCGKSPGSMTGCSSRIGAGRSRGTSLQIDPRLEPDPTDRSDIVRRSMRDFMSPKNDPEYFECKRRLRLVKLTSERNDSFPVMMLATPRPCSNDLVLVLVGLIPGGGIKFESLVVTRGKASPSSINSGGLISGISYINSDGSSLISWISGEGLYSDSSLYPVVVEELGEESDTLSKSRSNLDVSLKASAKDKRKGSVSSKAGEKLVSPGEDSVPDPDVNGGMLLCRSEARKSLHSRRRRSGVFVRCPFGRT